MLKRGLANRVVDEQHSERHFTRGSIMDMIRYSDLSAQDGEAVDELLKRQTQTHEYRQGNDMVQLHTWVPRDLLMQNMLLLTGNRNLQQPILDARLKVSRRSESLDLESIWNWISEHPLPDDEPLETWSCAKKRPMFPMQRHLLDTVMRVRRLRTSLVTYSEPEVLLMEIEALKLTDGRFLSLFECSLLIACLFLQLNVRPRSISMSRS